MFTKLLLTVAVVALIWFGFKYLTRLAELKQRHAQVPPRRPVAGRTAEAPAGEVQDMVKCPACSTWQPARGARACGRADCPY